MLNNQSGTAWFFLKIGHHLLYLIIIITVVLPSNTRKKQKHAEKVRGTCNRKSIETRGYLICPRGRSPRVLFRLPSVFFCIKVKYKNTFLVVRIWNPRKKQPMNEHLNMIFLSLSLSLPLQ
jgi:hypothetical protein